MDALTDGSLASMGNQYLMGIVLTFCLGLFVHLFGSNRVQSVLRTVKTRLFETEFPDYFALSGVPPPKPLINFDVDKAKPRPYRPFRWNYVQNMGMSNSSLSPIMADI